MKEDKKILIISIGVIVCLIILTWTIMAWPLGFSNEYFWIFIIVSFIEAVVVIIINEILKSKLKKNKKKKDYKKIQKTNNILLIVTFIIGAFLLLTISGVIWLFKEIDQYSKIYPSGTMTYGLDSYDADLIVPSYSIIVGEYWDELVVFKSPKNVDQLTKEFDDIFNSDLFIHYETDNGSVYYNVDEDYTITNYEIYEHLFMNTFNLTYCDGLCN